MAVVSSVVVVFPLVPVIATTGQRHSLKPSSISPITGIFLARTFCTSGTAGSIPGLSTQTSYVVGSVSAAAPSRTFTPCASRLAAFSRWRGPSELSHTVTVAPSSVSKIAAASPLSPRPSTTAVFPE